jgi:hypothetical protein
MWSGMQWPRSLATHVKVMDFYGGNETLCVETLAQVQSGRTTRIA